MERIPGVLAFIFMLLLLSCGRDDDPQVLTGYFPPSGSGGWETLSPEELGWDTGALPDLYDLLENNGTRAFIVLKNGRIVIEQYFGKNILGTADFNSSSYWYWASAGKTLTAFTVGKAQENGLLDITDVSSVYLGEGWSSLTSAQESAITIRHHLTMTTGLDDGVADNHSTLKEDLLYKAEAGTRWAYHNAPYTLLDSVVEIATGEDFETYFNSVLRDRTGMDGLWLWSDYDHVYYSTARSMARYGLLMLNNGDWDEEEIMSDKSYLNAMITPSQLLNKSYGYLWWLNGKESFMIPESQLVFQGSPFANAPSDMISGIGKNGQYVSFVPSQDLVLVRMGENPSASLVPFLFLDDIWEKLNLVID